MTRSLSVRKEHLHKCSNLQHLGLQCKADLSFRFHHCETSPRNSMLLHPYLTVGSKLADSNSDLINGQNTDTLHILHLTLAYPNNK